MGQRDSELPNSEYSKHRFASVFNGAWEKSATFEHAIKAFKYVGLFPLDESIVLHTANWSRLGFFAVTQ
ncbi:hypothetical protein DPMN_111299 [Dreissena polymorpha]|uniref:Uncharacterized protein n=1 Tax=Dreissena polymorpha TaxID=45954 RepID=A0A9D4KEM5_DREPO|nr:hypothetical protein DPMN_111299 [Dreissena polymorpha]